MERNSVIPFGHDALSRWSSEELLAQKASFARGSVVPDIEPVLDCAVASSTISGAMPSVGVIILAGGQGSRLGFNGPKGCFPILGKTLFAWHCEKIPSQIPIAVMTSSLNHRETVQFFEDHHFFNHSEIHFFSQKTLPLLNEQGDWFLLPSGQIAEGPDGNGSVFRAFANSGLLEMFLGRGVDLIHIVPVDNPLANPLDEPFLTAHGATSADLSVKVIRLNDSEEAMGRLVRSHQRLCIVEFAELTSKQRKEHLLANTGLLAIDLSLMQKLAKQPFPLHWAFRNCAWKAERFITDALLYAERVRPVCYLREACYAPLKEKNLIAAVEHSLRNRE